MEQNTKDQLTKEGLNLKEEENTQQTVDVKKREKTENKSR